MNIAKMVIFMGCAFVLSGCASILNPYKSEFQCPDPYKGDCVSTTTAYERSVSGEDEARPAICKDKKCSKKKSENGKAEQEPQAQVNPESVYQENLFKELSQLIEEPETPVIAPPNVVRILLLSYTGEDNQFYGWRYVYFMDGAPKWIYGTHDRAKRKPEGM
jgi:conjugal transfer pilus assembly protein TraV